ncbi:bifunctional tRNA (5-methylaminomethyl-2-thiouridine)(34)-methyltransferase MnmD/FAD-dependent 5-carboxymethylaminomethyl-2-thiouridine(34) oxidoreductase MnmC [Silvimonas iriomotensis]|uniref:tRNA 5-methylaminomethyl-2-thiouridine biosynthesis bifunctional protein MnmC n=1 Tax=Silvimonas iriomotensis TaxID=449662 RepID=A0ABQ2P5X2_9NEIS|nr:bifunctional tRNA (5-methylaminomethyl-2-thiouridine)(34)-methyltransferase MnmD/FAD-dependent 5-carboxymethylaminomethyl-2-thiouridine(34) oxidoreductase MnmC [Silvimonas iriomotensis]GGP18992.1 tRNA 5-methylaminomethyl-2-thiouridine biosynthesis bifunctional protein MnmC [Silvimonas iriomotensis]
MPYPAIVPAELAFAKDQIPWSRIYDDIYHSDNGGEAQVQHVFMAGNGLPERWRERDVFTIAETGFGQGLSFLVTWQAWQNDPQRATRLHFVSVEKHPFSTEDLAVLHQRYPALAALSAELLAQWPQLTPGFHRLNLDGGRVTLTLLLGEAVTLLSQLDARIDAIYLDGFSPDKNADIWSVDVLRALWRNTTPDTTLATYTVARTVRDALTEAGFAPHKETGFGSKRKRLAGTVAHAPHSRPVYAGERQALVIGAGMAGCAVAERLAARGWQVTVLDQSATPAQGASGNHVGLMHAHFTRDDNLLARLTRAGSEFTLQHLAGFATAPQQPVWGRPGLVQVARTADQAQTFRTIAHSGDWPAAMLRWLEPDQVAQQFSLATDWGAWWFERGAWVQPRSFCEASLARYADRIRFIGNQHVAQLGYVDGDWCASDSAGQLLARAPVAVLAHAFAAKQLPLAAELPLTASQRSTTLIAEGALPPVQAGISGAGYVTPALDGWHTTGAAVAQTGQETAAAAENIQRSQALFADCAITPAQTGRTRLCVRPGSADRMPLVGALPLPAHQQGKAHQLFHIRRYPDLYGLLGLGSRGLTFAPLAAELIAAQLNGEPLPLERDLVQAIDPARFLLRALRKGLPWPPQETAEVDDD